MTSGKVARRRVSGDGLAGLGPDALRGSTPKCLSHRHRVASFLFELFFILY